MSSSASFSTPATPMPRPAHLHHEDDLRPSSTSVVATLRHSPRLLLRKKASALKEPTQSPDIFARGPGPSLRASTRLQTRNTSAKLLNTRTKKASRQQLQLQHERTDNQLSQYTNSNNKTGSITTTTMTTTTTFSSTKTTTMMAHGGHHLDSTDMALDGPVQTRSRSTTIMVTEPSIASSHSSTNPTSRILAAPGQSPTSIAAEEASSLAATGMERRSKVATRSFSQTRETTRTRSSRTRARARTIPTKALKAPGYDEEKSDEDDDDEEESRFRYHLRSPGHYRRPRSLQKAATSDTAVEAPSISNLTLTPRLTRLGARHELGHGFEDEPDQEQSHQRNRHSDNVEKGQSHGRRSRSSTSSSSQDSQAAKSKAANTTYSSPGAQAAPRMVKKKSVGHHKVPSLPASRRRLRARTTKVAKMGVDGEDEDDEEEDEDEEEEEDEDVDFDPYRRNEQDADMMDVEPPSSGLTLRSQETEDSNTQSNYDGLDGFIASKPEASLVAAAGGLASYLSAQAIHHAKRKVEDEDMEDAPALSVDEGQVVSTKLARIDETSDGDKNTYLKTYYNILKSPRGDDDDGMLSSESDDPDLESEDDEDDFEEIDVWEFIATLPPLGPLPQNFTFTMPEKSNTTPPITLVLDIDETLVHCATRPLDSPDIIFPVEYNHETWEVYGRIRPGMEEFLEKMSTMFEVITFTASQECYAEALLKIIDPEKKYIRHRYYRDSCVPVFGNYVKDLRILNRDLSKVVIIDNSPQAFGYQISNGIPIESWYDDKSDRELHKVMSFLETLADAEDVRPKIDEHYKLQEKITKALALAAAQQQLSSMNGLGALGTALGSPSAVGSVSNVSTATSVLSSMTSALGSCNSTEANSLVSLQSVVPDNADMDAAMMLYDDIIVEKLPSPSDEDDEREEEDEKNNVVRGRRGRSKSSATMASGGGGGSSRGGPAATHGMTMSTRSNGLDASSLAQISL